MNTESEFTTACFAGETRYAAESILIHPLLMLHTVMLEYANSIAWLLDGQVASMLVSRLLTRKLHDISRQHASGEQCTVQKTLTRGQDHSNNCNK